ncbi:MAG: efflux RND transporter periplasmic adaptor subunit [Candidatus Tectomicrobia bacterium]|uniref:Efflux RND transporter periplasmic adaptor subunit n=1 Tax=Tectimicrobiota bacterium TaxID=2528274 RepID=A0A932CL53_UNCTE|nr:efflux RND transporter periplasmic adaptor subunit [Candidatus Tectomicrobia bacterium]
MGSLFSPSWYRVAELTPRIRSHAQIHRHQYRGQTWYVLQDLSTERFQRFSPAGYFIIGLMNGQRTVQQIWEIATERLGDDAPTQDEMIHLLSQLHAADVLQCNVSPDTAELLERYEKHQRRKWQQQLFSVFAWRIPLFDPERWLRRLLPLVRPLVGWAGLLLWLSVMAPAAVLAGVHWSDLTQDIVDRVLAPQSLVLLWLLFPLIKGLHEMGHALVTKAFGGEVHDMGVIILVLTPVPYVDASAAWAFRERWRRVAVGAAGMIVELFLAALALFLWLNVEPGTVRTLAYNTILIAGVSTVVFNTNPLLRFDGYYILADLIEIPNLRARSNAYMGYLAERYLFGQREAELPAATPGERAWFVPYAIASFLYRILVTVAILLFLAHRFFILTVILAAFGLIGWVIVPAGKGLAFLLTHPRLRSVRGRAIAVSVLLVGTLVGTLYLVPVPLRTLAEGVIWIPEESYVRAGTEGFVDRIVASPGTRVRRGDLLIVCRDPLLSTEVKVLEARQRELKARYTEQWPQDLVKAAIVREELQHVTERLARARQRAADLVVRSQAEGTFVVPQAEDLPGRFIRQGEQLAYVLDLETITVRTVIPQVNIELVRHHTQRVDVRLAERLADPLPATLRRIVPGATEQLPSTALGSQGGGQIPTDPTDAEGVKTIERLFQVDLELPLHTGVLNVGGRAYVRFDHGWEPLLTQAYRRVRQLFLSRFHI